jgi:predicted acyl esterase
MAELLDIPDQRVPMPDGISLSARLWRPAKGGSVPAVIEMIPYRKRDGTAARDEAIHPWLAARGYACLRVDLRGSGDSEGVLTDEYTPTELADACAVIAWAAAQPWCTGAVGMMGKSWGAFNALQVAALQPPALKAVIAVCGTVDRFGHDIHFKGGCLLGENFGWASTMFSYSSRPADPLLRADWREDWLRRLEANPWLAPRWASHQTSDDYWRHGSVGDDWSRLTVPILAFGGWADGYMNMVPALAEHSPGPVRGIIGPWVHLYPHMGIPGPRIGFLTEALRWWDRWLKGRGEVDTGLYRYVQHSAPPDPSAAHRPGHWIGPGGQIAWTAMALGSGLSGALPATVATPQHLGLAAGEYFPTGDHSEMPGDQAADDALSVCFDGPALAEPLTVAGAPMVRLRLTSDGPHATLIARLCDVAPDGASLRISHGMLNLSHRTEPAAPSPVPIGEAVEVTIPLDHLAHRLAPGHRLRLALSSNYWPFLWPLPVTATLAVEAGTLDLPVLTGASDWAPEPPEPLPEPRQTVARPGFWSRERSIDPLTGRHVLTIIEDTGDTTEPHGLTHGETVVERWEIAADDPLSARATIIWDQRLSRDGWSVQTLAETEITGTPTHLRMTAKVSAWEGPAKVFETEEAVEVPRDWV